MIFLTLTISVEGTETVISTIGFAKLNHRGGVAQLLAVPEPLT
jgi:hypothetical protein